jgi:hypothetical protein
VELSTVGFGQSRECGLISKSHIGSYASDLFLIHFAITLCSMEARKFASLRPIALSTI